MDLKNRLDDKDEVLDKIHALATDNGHLKVPYSNNQLAMANKVIENLEKKLSLIADLVQIGLRD